MEGCGRTEIVGHGMSITCGKEGFGSLHICDKCKVRLLRFVLSDIKAFMEVELEGESWDQCKHMALYASQTLAKI